MTASSEPLSETLPPDAPPPHAGIDGTMRTLGKGTAALVVSTAAFVLFGFFARVAIARFVTLAQWGEFSLGLALSSLLAIVIALGLPSAVSRAISYEPDPAERRRIVRLTLLVSLLSAVGGTAAVFAAAGPLARAFHDPGLVVVFELFAPAIGFTVVSTILAAYFQGVEQVGPNAVFNMALNPALFLVFLALALGLHTGFLGILVAYLISGGAACAALGVYAWWRLPGALGQNLHAAEADPTGHVSLLTMTVSLFGAGSLNLLTQFADTLILGIFWSTAVVGLYAAGMTLARLFLAGASSLVYIYLPVSSRLRRLRDFDGLRQTYVTSARWVTIITLPVFCVFFFEPSATLGFVFGPNYAGGVLALRVLTLASFLSVVVGPANAGLSGLGHPAANMVSAGTSLVANVALSLALIPTWGLIGAAVAWSVARLVYVGLCLAFIWRYYGISPFVGRFVRPLVGSLVVLTPVFLMLPPLSTAIVPLLALVVLSLVVCLASIPLTRSLDRGDIALYGAAERLLGVRFERVRRFLESRIDPAAHEIRAATPSAGPRRAEERAVPIDTLERDRLSSGPRVASQEETYTETVPGGP